jgi:hypothetical protein
MPGSLDTYDVLEGHQSLPEFTAALIEHGYSDDDILLILGGNFYACIRNVITIVFEGLFAENNRVFFKKPGFLSSQSGSYFYISIV